MAADSGGKTLRRVGFQAAGTTAQFSELAEQARTYSACAVALNAQGEFSRTTGGVPQPSRTANYHHFPPQGYLMPTARCTARNLDGPTVRRSNEPRSGALRPVLGAGAPCGRAVRPVPCPQLLPAIQALPAGLSAHFSGCRYPEGAQPGQERGSNAW